MMFGRERELSRLGELITRSDVNLITLTGLPGVGKSHLARAILSEVSDGLFATVPDGGLHSIGDALLTSLADRRALAALPTAALWECFNGRRVVVVLDNAGGAANLAAQVVELLAGYPNLLLLLTSARPTRIPGERAVSVRPLPLPRADANEAHPVVGLFLQRAADIGMSFNMSDPTVRNAVVRVCRRTGGLPLAVELAAARTATQPLRFIERTLWRHGHADHSGRHDRLRRSLISAISMVSASARLALGQAAQFAAPFQLDAAEAVINLPSSETDVYEALSELVDAYLLEFDTGSEEDCGQVARFAMREPVRALALEQLDGDLLEAVRLRHAAYFRDRCRAGTDVAAREWPDIAQALDFALRRGIVDDALIVGAAASPALRRLAGTSTHLRAGLDRLVHGDGSLDHASDPVTRSRAMVWSAVLFPIDAEDLATVGLWTTQRLVEATDLARESGNVPALLEALETTVRSLNVTLDLPAASAAVHEGLALARALDDQRAIARFEVWCAMEAQMRGNLSATIELASAALARGRAHHEPIAVIWASRMLHLAPESMRPSFDPPLPDLTVLLDMCERAAQPYSGMIILGDLARRDLACGDLGAAARWTWRQLMVSADRIHSEPLSTAYGVVNAVSIALRAGDLPEAVRMREGIRSVESLLPTYLPPQLAREYSDHCALLEESVSQDSYTALTAEVAGSSMAEANRRAQAWVQRLAGRGDIHGRPHKQPIEALTAREREVLTCLASGATNREIGVALGVSPKTVMHHSVSIYRKLGVRGRAAATVWAARSGLLDDAG